MTALIIAALNTFFSSQKPKWTIVSKKSVSWLKFQSNIANLDELQE